MAKLIGTNPNQVPTNADLGDMAYQNGRNLAKIKAQQVEVESGAAQSNLYLRTNDDTHYDWRLTNEGNVNRLRLLGAKDGLTSIFPMYVNGDAGGAITMPAQPAFWVRRNGDLSGYNGNDYTSSVTFNYEIYDTGNNFDTSTGLFTAPVTGVYLFWGGIYASSGSAISQMWLTYNGGRNEGTDWTRSNNGQFINITAHVKLNANDTVGLHPYGSIGNIIANPYHTWFKGILVG